MHKETEAGIDVSKDVLDVAVRRDERQLETARFDNDGAGHKKLVRWLMTGGRTVRVVLESTGTYSLDVALALQRTAGIAAMPLEAASEHDLNWATNILELGH